MKNKGFTLVELLVVIVILAIILAIAVPTISSILETSKKNAFESSAKMMLNGIRIKSLEDSTFDVTTINISNVETLLKIDKDNYSKISVKYDSNNKPYISVEGSNKWSGYTAYGNYNTLSVENSFVTDGLIVNLDAGNKNSYSGTGTIWYDLSGNGYDFTLINNPTFSALNQGKFDFINDGRRIEANLDSFARTIPTYTFTSFFYLSGNNAGSPFSFQTNQVDMNNADGFWQHTAYPWPTYDQSAWLWRTEDDISGERGASIGTSNIFVPGNWYHIAVIVGTNSLSFYKNNTLIGTAATNFEWSKVRTDFPLYFKIGSSFIGSVADIKIYNRALSASEISQNYNAQKSRYGL